MRLEPDSYSSIELLFCIARSLVAKTLKICFKHGSRRQFPAQSDGQITALKLWILKNWILGGSMGAVLFIPDKGD